MNLLTKEYGEFLEKAHNHSFKNLEGIFINNSELPKNTIFGIDKNNFLIIILPLGNQISGFQIKDFITLKDKKTKDLNNSLKAYYSSSIFCSLSEDGEKMDSNEFSDFIL